MKLLVTGVKGQLGYDIVNAKEDILMQYVSMLRKWISQMRKK